MAQTLRESWVERVRERWLDWLVAAVLLGLFGVAVGGSRAAFTGSAFPLPWQPWWDGFLQNSGTEMLGAFLTFILLEVIRGRRERKAQEEAEERRTKATQKLLREFIQAQELARLRAAQTPGERQPILDSMRATGLLEGANLGEANLQGANLSSANLQRAGLVGADLRGADLVGANLRGAWLVRANLQGVRVWRANLQGVLLFEASLRGARLLKVEQLRQAKTLEGTTLPDGTILPFGVNWREAFEAWCETVETETVDGEECIIPADLDDDE